MCNGSTRFLRAGLNQAPMLGRCVVLNRSLVTCFVPASFFAMSYPGVGHGFLGVGAS